MPDLDAVAEVGQSVAEVLRPALPHPDRQVAGGEAVGIALGAQPEHHLARDEQREVELAEQRGSPSAGGQDQAIGGHRTLGRLDRDRRLQVVQVGGRPASDGGVEAQFGARAGSELELGGNAALNVERAGALLKQADQVVVRGHHREAAADLSGGQRLVGDAVPAGAGERAGHEQAVVLADHQRAGGAQQLAARGRAELVPEFVGALHERHVGGVFVVGLADDAGVAVGGAEVVGRAELVEADHAEAAPGEHPGGGGTHRAKSDDGCVVVRHGWSLVGARGALD